MAHRHHQAQDIIPGARWPSILGPGHAIVRETAAGYVEFAFSDGAAVLASERMHHAQFRARFAAPYDARAVRSWFSVCASNLQSFHAFFYPATRRFYARTTRRSVDDAFTPSRGRGGAVPKGAAYVGTYAAPCSPDAFFKDLHDALAASTRRGSAVTAT